MRYFRYSITALVVFSVFMMNATFQSPGHSDMSLGYGSQAMARSNDVADLLDDAETLIKNKEYQKAKDLADRIIKKDPTVSEGYRTRATALRRLNDPKAAMADYNTAIKLDPKNHRAYNGRSAVKIQSGDLTGALADVNRSLELKADYAAGLDNRAMIYHEQREYAKAIKDSSRAITLDPGNALFYSRRGAALEATNDLKGALNDYNKALSIAPDEPFRLNARGRVLTKLGRPAEAIADHNKALKLDYPKDKTLALRGQAYMAKKMDKEAKEDFRQALQYNPNNTQAKDMLAIYQPTKTQDISLSVDSGDSGVNDGGRQKKDRNEISILVVTCEYENDLPVRKQREALASSFDYIIEPQTFENLVEQVKKFGKNHKIRKLVFVGHGSDVSGKEKTGIRWFNKAWVDSDTISPFWSKPYIAGDSSTIDAFADDAEIISYNCFTGADPNLLEGLANLFLSFSGGTVYGSKGKVSPDLSIRNNIFYIPYQLGITSGEDLQHRGLSSKDYKVFQQVSMKRLACREKIQPANITIDGPATVKVSKDNPQPVTLTAKIPESWDKPDVKPFIKYKWRLSPNKNVIGKDRQLIIPAKDIENGKKYKYTVEVRLENNKGARKLADATFEFSTVNLSVGINASNDHPQAGTTITCNAKLTFGKPVVDAFWIWSVTGDLEVVGKANKTETASIKAYGKGVVNLQYFRFGQNGSDIVLATASLPINTEGKQIKTNTPRPPVDNGGTGKYKASGLIGKWVLSGTKIVKNDRLMAEAAASGGRIKRDLQITDTGINYTSSKEDVWDNGKYDKNHSSVHITWTAPPKELLVYDYKINPTAAKEAENAYPMTATVDTGGSWIRTNTSGSWAADYSLSLQQYHNLPGATLETTADSGPGITSDSGHARVFNSEGPDHPDNPRAKGSPIYKATIKLQPILRSDTDKRDISVKVVTSYGQVAFMYKWVPAGR